MEIIKPPSEWIEIHVKMTRTELANLVDDMEGDCTNSNPFMSTEEFLTYLKGL